MDEVNHISRVSFVLLPHDFLLPYLCIVSKCFVSFMLLCSYDHAGQMDCSTVDGRIWINPQRGKRPSPGPLEQAPSCLE